ncbi:TnsA endonuclease N-terminal domain-containing protein [Methylotenera sp.]|jgi:hypothetical protein|uniref:TnsA endonuclease N-terminal domain-containing protein n=1 Tax=Methylotenera sp. TaxID=2051956 RepID=UPI0027304943|nr:TnsA endonuclease N-terminal domain-containing protein [Methylotenera sp.]MDP2072510.1 TnsA endonuclease N-terminal domain-containing protein [Methylotenera sp.]MDP2229541.1 TnsA endonuclease N-terminal domain-containing protein [Methylotenera sp.]MDP3005979.1 TnsA endonuclease N-terminal domain-containing protein [Methylotenera sp.]MDP3140915.1 TnsA endonuclease N-terminal domain-containing protein [Methylotenera sp.]
MAKRRYGFDEAKITRFLKEGRGEGHGSDYQPWLTIQDVSSHGRSTRIHCRKTQREHHLLSDNETAVFLLLDWSDAVTDIREQFPLDRELTRRIATEMGVTHPVDPHSRTEIVMTTDFLVDVRGGISTVLMARSVKPITELDNERTLEKQEIERRYWEIKGVEWGLITDFDLPEQRIKNLRWLHEMQSLEYLEEPYSGYWKDRCNRFLICLQQATSMTIKQFNQHLESAQGFAKGEPLMIIRHLAANKKISINLDAKFDMSNLISVLGSSEISNLMSKTA